MGKEGGLVHADEIGKKFKKEKASRVVFNGYWFSTSYVSETMGGKEDAALLPMNLRSVKDKG